LTGGHVRVNPIRAAGVLGAQASRNTAAFTGTESWSNIILFQLLRLQSASGRMAQVRDDRQATPVALLFAGHRWIAAHGVTPLSPVAIGSRLALIAALPALLLAIGFFRHGEMQALRSMIPRRAAR
jgi:hypothetical protein